MRRQTIAASIEALSVVATALGIFTSIPKQVGAQPENAGLMDYGDTVSG